MKIKLTFVLSSIFFLFGLFFLSQQTVKAFEFSNPTEIVENIGIVPHGPYLYYPADMVKDNAGNIYISESGNNRVLKYDIGTSNWVAMGSEGAGVGQFNWPEKIEVDNNGNVYVADYGNDRIQKYDIGTTSWSIFMDSGVNLGQVENPYAIHFDTFGNIFVTDDPSWSSRIQKYDVGTSAWTAIATSGTAVGKFRSPKDLTTDDYGNLYVADSDNDRIQKYDIGTTTWTVLGTGGDTVGKFDWPTGIDIDSNGDLYVADGDNSRLQKYNVGTTTWEILTDYVTLFEHDLTLQNSYPYGIYIDNDDNMFVADIWNDRLQVYDTSSDSWSVVGAYGNRVGQFGIPEKIEKDTLGNFYVTDSDNDRIQKYDIGTTSWSIFLDSGTALGQVNNPTDIRIDILGNIYVSDSTRIQKYSVGTTTWSVFSVGGTGLGQVGTIHTLGVDKIGNIYVGDSYNDSSWNYIYRLQKYNVGTSQWSIMATSGTEIGQVKRVYDIEFDSIGNMYLADYTNKRVQKYDVGTSSWSVFGTGSTGTSPGDFLYPYGILIDNFDNVYVTEIDWSGLRNNIQKYDVGSSSWYKTGTSGFNPGEFSSPTDIEVDEYSNLYIVDSNNHRIQKFWYYHLANYSSSDNGSVVGSTSQKLSIGQSGTQVIAVGSSGYAFLQWSDGSVANPRIDVGKTDALNVTASFTNTRTITDIGTSNMQSEVERNFISIGSTDPTTTPNFTFNINYTFLAGSASIVFPAQTVVTPVGTSTIDLTQFRTIDNTIDIQTSLDRTLKSIQIGIPNFNLSFSSPVTVTIPVGTNYNNQTLSVVYRRESDTNWNDETSCLIIDGNCTFQTTHATTFTVLENQTQSSNNNNNSSSNIYIPDHSCHSSKPQFISDLFQIDTTKNTAKIFFTPQRDTNDYFVSFSSINSNAEEHGERVTLLREGVQSHTIYSLKPNTTYYVKVRGQNGCMPGDWSNIMQFKTNSKIYYRSSPITKSNLSTENKSNITTKLPIKTTNVSPPTLPPIESPSSVNSQPTKQVVSTPTPIPKKKCFLWWCW